MYHPLTGDTVIGEHHSENHGEGREHRILHHRQHHVKELAHRLGAQDDGVFKRRYCPDWQSPGLAPRRRWGTHRKTAHHNAQRAVYGKVQPKQPGEDAHLAKQVHDDNTVGNRGTSMVIRAKAEEHPHFVGEFILHDIGEEKRPHLMEITQEIRGDLQGVEDGAPSGAAGGTVANPFVKTGCSPPILPNSANSGSTKFINTMAMSAVKRKYGLRWVVVGLFFKRLRPPLSSPDIPRPLVDLVDDKGPDKGIVLAGVQSIRGVVRYMAPARTQNDPVAEGEGFLPIVGDRDHGDAELF